MMVVVVVVLVVVMVAVMVVLMMTHVSGDGVDEDKSVDKKVVV